MIYLYGNGSSIDAGEGNNTISGFGYGSTIKTGSGDDLVIDSSGSIDAGEGNNTIISGGRNSTIKTGACDDYFLEGTGSVRGFYSAYIDAGDGNNFFNSSGSLTITTGVGSDTVIVKGGGNAINTGEGEDTIVIDESSGSNFINAGNGINVITIYKDGDTTWTDNTVIGGKDDDSIEIEGGANSINTGEGKNFVKVRGRSNTVTSGASNDTVEIAGGYNFVNAGAGNDVVEIAGGYNFVNAGAGNNVLTIYEETTDYYNGHNTVTSGAGNDVVKIIGEYNSVSLGEGVNFISLGSYTKENGYGYGGINTVQAGNGNDTIIVDGERNSISAGNGRNFIAISAMENSYDNGSNTITTGADADTILVSCDLNIIDAGDSDNYVVLSSYTNENGGFYGGQNTVTSGAGNDTIEIEGGTNSISAGDGDNFINIRGTIGGYSTISAGSGNDTIKVSFQVGSYIDAGDGDNLVDLFGSSTVSAGTGNDTVRIIGNDNKNINVGDGDNYVIIGTNTLDANPAAGSNTVTGGAGNDTIIIENSWANSVDAGDGDNYLYVDATGSTIIAGDGDDTITNIGGGSFHNAGKGKNLIVLNPDNGLGNTIISGEGDDTIQGFNWFDVVFLEGSYTTLLSGNNFYIQNNGHTILLTDVNKINFAPNIQGGALAGGVDFPSDDGIDIPTGAWAVVVQSDGTKNAVYSDSTVANGTNSNDTIKVSALTSGSSRAIYGNGGNDSIDIHGVEQDWSDGIDNYSNVTIHGGAGQDTVYIYGNNFAIRDATVSIDGGADDDYIHTTGKENNVAIFNSAVTLNGGTGNDTIEVGNKINEGAVAVYAQSSLKIYGGEGDDKVTVNGGIRESEATIDGGDGDNEFNFLNEQYSPFYSVTLGVISSGDGDDTVNFYSGGNNGILCSTLSVDVGNGNNLVSVKANDNAIVNSTFTIKSGVGKDTINLNGNTYHGISQSTGTINTSAGNDLLNITTNTYSGIYQATVSIDVADGDDTILIYGKGSKGINQSEVKINGGIGNDEINIDGRTEGIFYSTVTAAGGTGADTINVKAEIGYGSMYSRYLLDGGEESDYINISGNTGIGGYSTMTATGGASNDTINVSGTDYGIGRSYDSIDGGDGDDLITISADEYNGIDYSEVTINGGTGNDTININAGRFGIAASAVSIDGGAGQDLIKINGDTLGIGYGINYNYDSDTKTSSTIKGTLSNVTINGGADSDTIYVNSIDVDAEVLIYAGAGDNISVGSGGANYLFDSTDNVTINGVTFKASEANTSADIQTSDTAITLGSKWSGTVELKGNYTLTDLGGSVIKSAGLYNVVDGKITLPSSDNTWQINGTTATYGTTDKTLITLTGLKDGVTTNDFSLEGKAVILKPSALGTGTVELTGEGYSLALADDVAKVQDVAASWSVTNGNAIYKGGKTSGYTLSGNKINYSQAVEGATLATITGLKSDATADGITLNDKVITLSASVLDTNEVTLTGDGYSLAPADDVARPTAVQASWKVTDGIATYRGSTTAGYVVENNKVTYQAASDDESIMTVTGLNVNAIDNDISLENGVLTFSASAIGNDTITIEKTVDVSKISAGKAGNFLIGTQTFKTDTPVDFIINSDGKVSAVELANMESTMFTNSADNISILGGTGNDFITNSGNNITFKAGLGNDTISNSGANNIFQYTKGDCDDIIVGFTESDTLIISSDTYNTSIVGGDLQINLVKSKNTIILKDGANLTPNIEGTWSDGYFDKDGNEIKNPVAQIEIDGEIYYYESVARATNDADNNSTVTVTANSTETSAINVTKGLTIQFTESGLGVYNVTGGNFVSADNSKAANFSISSNRVISNSNSLLINNGATATLDGYEVTGTSNGYTFALQENSFTLNNVSYGGSGSATFDTSGNVSLTSGAIANTNDTATINIAAGDYSINGVEFSAASNNKAVTTADGVKFNLSSDNVIYNSMTFSGAGTATFAGEIISLTGGAIVSSVAAGQAFTFNGSGTYKLNNKTIVTLSEKPFTVTNTADGLTIGENIFSITGDDEYRINVDANGNIVSASNINGGSTIINSGGADSILTSSAGNFTFGDKTFAIVGDDSVTFGLSSDGAVTKIADITGTVSGDFTGAININGNAADVQVTGDESINVTASNIFGVSNNASVIGTGGASIVSTDEEGTFNFYDSQNFTVGGDNSVDFKVNNSVVTGFANFENGTLQVDNAAKLSINNENLTTQFTDTANFIIADSQVISVEGVTVIDGLNNATVHAAENVTVNGAKLNASGDSDYNVIVSDSKTTELLNISAGASVSVSNVNVTTDNNGEFKVGENLYTINDVDNSVTFITGSNGAVSNVTNFSGTLNTNSRNVTVNGAALTTNDTNVTISSAGAGISQINGVGSGDVLSGAIDSAAVSVTVTSADDIALWRLNSKTYMLTGDSDGVQVTGNRIDGLDNAASLEVGAAGNYLVNNTPLDAKIGDTIIGTAEGSAYIFDPNNVPLNVSTMTDDEISAQVGISTEFATSETDTEKSAALINDVSKLNGNMELALSNSDTTTAQTADFTNSTGKKKVTLAEGSQEVNFNDEGGNVAVIESDSAGEKNIMLGNGGDLAIVKGTSTPVNITAGMGKDTIVTSGNNVTVDMKGGATKIVPNGGNVNLTNYDAATGAGIQVDEVSDIERAVQNGNINFGNGVVSLGSATINLGGSESESTTVNLFDNKGRKTKVAYTHSDGGTIDATNSREKVLLVGNNNSTKSNGSSLKSGAGNDIAFGGAGDYFDLGAGNNRVYLNSNRNSGATVAMTATEGITEVNGFNSGFGENADKISINVADAKVSFKGGKITFSIGNASLILNFGSSSADLIEDDNLIGESADLSDITPITYEQGDYQDIYDASKNSLKSDVQITFTGA